MADRILRHQAPKILEPMQEAGGFKVHKAQMSTALMMLGFGIATMGFAGRGLYQLLKSPAGQQVKKTLENLPTSSYYYKGGFEPKMTNREAHLILGVSTNASKAKVKQAHKRIMILNHPDKGGSPYLAAKINEAKDVIESGKK